jgi:hypothetical protein
VVVRPAFLSKFLHTVLGDAYLAEDPRWNLDTEGASASSAQDKLLLVSYPDGPFPVSHLGHKRIQYHGASAICRANPIQSNSPPIHPRPPPSPALTVTGPASGGDPLPAAGGADAVRPGGSRPRAALRQPAPAPPAAARLGVPGPPAALLVVAAPALPGPGLSCQDRWQRAYATPRPPALSPHQGRQGDGHTQVGSWGLSLHSPAFQYV